MTRDVCQKLVEAADEVSGVLLDLMRDVTVEPQVRLSVARAVLDDGALCYAVVPLFAKGGVISQESRGVQAITLREADSSLSIIEQEVIAAVMQDAQGSDGTAFSGVGNMTMEESPLGPPRALRKMTLRYKGRFTTTLGAGTMGIVWLVHSQIPLEVFTPHIIMGGGVRIDS